jgi:sugar lactone lactonase YvrE
MIIQHSPVIRYSGRILPVVLLLLIVLAQGVFAAETCTLVRTWGSYEGGSPATASGVATDSSDNVYVTSPGNNRIQEFSSDGSMISFRDLGESGDRKAMVPGGIAVDSSGNVYTTDRKNNTVMKFSTWESQAWGREGSGDGQFSHPTGIAIDSSGNVYIADTGNNRIQKFHSTGLYLLQWGSYGTSDGAFNAPEGIAIDSHDIVYVTDTGNRRIQKFTSDGTFLAKWGSEGTGKGQFSTPTGIAADSWGNVYVADHTPRVQEFSPTGEYFTSCKTGGNTHAVAIDSYGYLYALWQSGAGWKIGKYGTPSLIPTPTPSPIVYPFALDAQQANVVIAPSAVPTRLQDSAVVTSPPVTTTLTTAPNASPVTLVAPILSPTTGVDAMSAAPGDHEGDVWKTDVKTEIFGSISTFFRDLFGVEIKIPA